MTPNRLNWIAGYIWGIADDVLRDLYVRGKYRDVILPMTVLRRLDAAQRALAVQFLIDEFVRAQVCIYGLALTSERVQ